MDWDGLRYFLAVARTSKVSEAGRRLGVEHSTVSRRIRQLEHDMGTVLFDKSRRYGYLLTEAGRNLLQHAEKIESELLHAQQVIKVFEEDLSGNIRVAATEGFGVYMLTPLAVEFQKQYPNTTLEIMPFQRFIDQSRREADIFITIDRPLRGNYVYRLLSDYRLRLYASPQYLKRHDVINDLQDLAQHQFIDYIDEFIISDELKYLSHIIPDANVVFKSNSLVAQLQACVAGQAMAVLPCFMVHKNMDLQVVLPEEVAIKRSFWMLYHEDLRQLKRIELFSNFLKNKLEQRQDLMMGE
ncbi:MAG: LysR family transcriptional regulator [Alcaligenaceae bacterium]|jgi:DNA-binding transcriptional LysR family regulator|nr:LysR family transcriptional regulator [Alcaligenaceae bacterium]